MKTRFLEKLASKLDRVDPVDLQLIVGSMLREKGYFEQVFEALKEGVILLNSTGGVSFLNSAACKFFGLNKEISIGVRLSDLIRGLDWNSMVDSGNVVSRDIEVFYPEHRFLHFYLSPIHKKEMDFGFVMIVNDMTTTRTETQAAIESERINTLTLLAAGVAHEVGNPLNSLDIHLQLLERKIKNLIATDRENLNDHLVIARQEICRLDGILKQFLQAIRPSGVSRLENVNLMELLNNCIVSRQLELNARGINVVVNAGDSIAPMELDALQMEQVFYNLLRNAAQAISSDDGGVITIDVLSNDYEVKITICDNGSGISAEQMGVLFEPFNTTKEKGTGLGLLIVRRIVREHGGEIEIKSSEGVGTKVKIYLPLAPRLARLLPRPETIIEMEKID
jgi:two-component system, sporulation sensor kinase E